LAALFDQPKTVIGMIHVGALPGTPRNRESLDSIIHRACEEARALARAGVDGLMIENMHDVPYLKGAVGAEIVAAMTAVGCAVREATGATGGSSTHAASEQSTGSKLPVAPSEIGARSDSRTSVGAPALPLGVQILAAANREALAVALACDADFVRVENFAYAHVADEGLMPTAEAGPLLRYRKEIGAEHIKIIADVKKKHSSHALTADVSLAEAARTAEFFGADAIVVTGTATGQPTSPADVATVKQSVSIPVCIGSGLTPANLPDLWPHADVFIVGSYFKVDGLWSHPVDPQRVADFMTTVARLRESA
jgi:membrane complex biogenesis BtpA family protein